VLPLPQEEQSLNIRALARIEREEFTGVVGTVITLAQSPIEAAAPPGTSLYVDIYKNGALMSNVAAATYSIAGKVITFNAALIAGDVVVVKYYGRGY